MDPIETKSQFVLVEHHTASDRSVVEAVGVLELAATEVADMNRAMVKSNCRILPARWFDR